MKHKTFSKENEKKLKQIIRALKDEVRRLETENKELKKEAQRTGKPKKPKAPKENPPTKEVKQPTKQVDKSTIRPKAQKPMSDAERAAFCTEFSRRFKQSRGENGKPESAD